MISAVFVEKQIMMGSFVIVWCGVGMRQVDWVWEGALLGSVGILWCFCWKH